MRFTTLIISAAFILGASAPASAQQDEQFKQLVDEALEHYKAKQYDQAIISFEAAYKMRQEPELMYNIARSYEKSLKRQEAIDAYDKFLNMPGSTSELRTTALEAIEALKREQAAMSRKDDPVAPPRTTPATSRSTTDDKTNGPLTTTTPAEREGPSHTLEWVLIGGGAGALVVYGVFGGLALSAHSDFEDPMTPAAEKDDLRTTIKRDALIADISLGVGLVSAGIGVVMLLVGGDDSPSEGGVALTPVINTDAASLALSGIF